MRTFWFHYNKPASKIAGKPQISVHYNNSCHIVDEIECLVPTFSKINKRQPFFVMKGKYNNIIRNLDNGKRSLRIS